MNPQDNQGIDVYLVRSVFDKYGVTVVKTFLEGEFRGYMQQYGKLPSGVVVDAQQDSQTYMITDQKLYLGKYSISLDKAVELLDETVDKIEQLAKISQIDVL